MAGSLERCDRQRHDARLLQAAQRVEAGAAHGRVRIPCHLQEFVAWTATPRRPAALAAAARTPGSHVLQEARQRHGRSAVAVPSSPRRPRRGSPHPWRPASPSASPLTQSERRLPRWRSASARSGPSSRPPARAISRSSCALSRPATSMDRADCRWACGRPLSPMNDASNSRVASAGCSRKDSRRIDTAAASFSEPSQAPSVATWVGTFSRFMRRSKAGRAAGSDDTSASSSDFSMADGAFPGNGVRRPRRRAIAPVHPGPRLLVDARQGVGILASPARVLLLVQPLDQAVHDRRYLPGRRRRAGRWHASAPVGQVEQLQHGGPVVRRGAASAGRRGRARRPACPASGPATRAPRPSAAAPGRSRLPAGRAASRPCVNARAASCFASCASPWPASSRCSVSTGSDRSAMARTAWARTRGIAIVVQHLDELGYRALRSPRR